MPLVTVNLGERSYDIHIEAGCLSQAASLLSTLTFKKAVVLSNTTVAPLYLSQLKDALTATELTCIEIPDGEQYKTLAQYESIMTTLLSSHVSRDTLLIALGGGVVGDLCGFVAATYQRGIPFVQIPTTLLSQVDSSVGGKTAVNHPLGKNMIGAFYQPAAVIIDPQTLRTLPPREFAAGMAEVIKYGIIYDAEFFGWLEDNVSTLKQQDPATLATAIQRCCQIKADIVAQDEREGGIRALLNLGHTFGHAIEAQQGYGNWLHGEAVAAGIILACKTAEHELNFTVSETRRVAALLNAFELPTAGPDDMSYDDYMRHMSHDKKVLDSKIRFILPTSIGAAIVTSDVQQDTLTAVLTHR
ncbi:3-dehydroquinate synthase [Alteromonas oceanisediminis]|uniref:3-dehydroquinate synthase n=1 Tax=Alteromonas oceanisediminis TaxID=2836180 RepID=UPI001BD9A936|nr:3-dehydroquinate synthase [Alteromonas oceanisediminis]MBT0586097.1 3-dehydroquinate synthase [Alteromonas oceanisediminis]